VHCIESTRLGSLAAAVAALAIVSACSTRPTSAPAPAPIQRSSPSPAAAAQPAPTSSARSWEEYRVQAARRIVAANPQVTHNGAVIQPLLAIPVLEVELNGDGSVRNISVMREPSQAKETTRVAIDAVRRAGPFGDVSRLPRPWRFSEAFLFNDDGRFKPRSLDQ
jgi:hypothetical protein